MTQILRNLLLGMGRMFDFSGSRLSSDRQASMERLARIVNRSDSEALRGDFEQVGQNLRKAMNGVTRKYGYDAYRVKKAP